MLIYQSTITQIGQFAEEARAEKMLITFKQGVPDELRDYCFVHSPSDLSGIIQVGDQALFDGVSYPITAIGEVAIDNLAELGHVTWLFDGATEALYPGTIHLAGDVPQLAIGSVFGLKQA